MLQLERSYIQLGGVTLNAVEGTGVDWILSQVAGWEASGSTIDPQQRPRGNGAWAGEAFHRSRVVVLNGSMVAPSQDKALDAVERLLAAHSMDATRMTVTETFRTLWMMVRRSDEPIVTWLTDLACDFSLQMVAVDPRRFGEPLSLSLGLPQTVNGLQVPFTVPFSIPSYRNTAELVNDGITAGPVMLRISGPVTNPVVTHTGSSGTQVFALRITLGAGEWLDINPDDQPSPLTGQKAHSVLAQGTAGRNGSITQRGWHSMDPGLNSWAFSADHYTTAQLTITAVPAF